MNKTSIKYRYFFLLFIILFSCNNKMNNNSAKSEVYSRNLNNYYYENCDSIITAFASKSFIDLFGKERYYAINKVNKDDKIGIILKINLDGLIRDIKIFKSANLSEIEKKSFISYLIKLKIDLPCTNNIQLENKSREELEKMKEVENDEFLFVWYVYIYNSN